MNRTFLMALAPVLAAAALAPASAFAQTQGPAPILGANATLLSISAEGRSTRTPDLATFNAGVTSQGDTAAGALAANSTDMARVIAALKRAGIADRDIQTSNLSLSPIYAPQRQLPDGTMTPVQPKIVGYQANNSVSVRQRKLGDFGKVIDTLVSAGANQVNGPSFEMENPDPGMDEARVEAMTKARTRAELYAKAAGLRVGRILSISESGGWAPPQPVMYRMARAEAAMAPPPPVQAGELSLNMTVSVQFELVP
ncbi:MAG: SIMPL domain-containing protein [Pseudomonadota bacterium]